MATSSGLQQVRSALSSLIAGKSQLLAFERSVAEVIAKRSVTRSDLWAELEGAVIDGTLPPSSLRRLGLEDCKIEAPAVQPPETDAQVQDTTRPPGGDETRIRAFSTSPTDTESVWYDPEMLGASRIISTGVLLGGRYLLEYVLGEGGMGVVYRATDQEVKGEIFAVKVLRPEIREHRESLRFLREEVRKTRALRHPNIVGVYSLNSDPAGIYMLMEYLEGKSVKALLDEEFGRGMPLMRALPLIHDIGEALAYAHDHNVVHSDLKPSNVFVTMSGKAKLLDFGIARAVRGTPDRFDPGALGALTPAYASCEMLEGRTPDQSDDVYAFACVIFEMLTGRHPFDRLCATDARRAELRPAPIATLTPAQNKAIAQALNFERAGRTASVEALLAGLEGRRPAKREGGPPLIWVGAGVAACAIAGIAAWLLLRTPSSSGPPTASAAKPGVVVAPPTAPVPAVKPPVVEPPVVEPRAPEPRVTEPPAAKASSAEPSGGVKPTATPATTALSTPPAAAPAPAPASAAAKPAPVKPAAADKSTGATLASAAPGPANHSAAPLPGAGGATDGALSREELDSAAVDAAAATTGDAPAPAAATPTPPAVNFPPVGKNIPAIVPVADALTKVNSCPYPAEARNQVETGTVVMLVYVAPDGAAATTRLDKSSGSASLDQAALNCVQESGRFPPKLVGKQSVGYWGRMKFNWSFGD